MSKLRFGPLALAALAGLVAGYLVYGARFPSNCLDSYPPICSNMYGQALRDDWDQPVWWPTLAAGAITFLIAWAAAELVFRWRVGQRKEPSN
jgi:hypothetical protein